MSNDESDKNPYAGMSSDEVITALKHDGAQKASAREARVLADLLGDTGLRSHLPPELSEEVDRIIALRSQLPRGLGLLAAESAWPLVVKYADSIMKVRLAEALAEVARDLGVDQHWLATLPQRMVDRGLRASSVVVGVDPAAPGGDRSVEYDRLMTLELRVSRLEAYVLSDKDQGPG